MLKKIKSVLLGIKPAQENVENLPISVKEPEIVPAPDSVVVDEKSPYNQDGLHSVHNHDFMKEAGFMRAYQRGIKAADDDYKWHWRAHIGLWAAHTAHHLDGDFVECGVNRGFLSSAIMEYLDWNKLDKKFYLLDTFEGLNHSAISEGEEGKLEWERNNKNLEIGFYTNCYEEVLANFSEFKNTQLIKGMIPDTLVEVDTQKIAYLHLDLNCAPPEIAAFKYFWPKIVLGGVILLDDYAYIGYESQKHAMDAVTAEVGVKIASLPTGQGLIIKTKL